MHHRLDNVEAFQCDDLEDDCLTSFGKLGRTTEIIESYMSLPER